MAGRRLILPSGRRFAETRASSCGPMASTRGPIGQSAHQDDLCLPRRKIVRDGELHFSGHIFDGQPPPLAEALQARQTQPVSRFDAIIVRSVLKRRREGRRS